MNAMFIEIDAAGFADRVLDIATAHEFFDELRFRHLDPGDEMIIDDLHAVVEAIGEVFFMGVMEAVDGGLRVNSSVRSEEHTSELQSLMRISYAVFCL